MGSLNIRLGPDDARAVEVLRRDNVNVSQLLRDAIRAAVDSRKKNKTRWTLKNIDVLLAKIDAIDCTTPDWIEQNLDVTDRAQMAAYRRKRAARKLGNLANP